MMIGVVYTGKQGFFVEQIIKCAVKMPITIDAFKAVNLWIPTF